MRTLSYGKYTVVMEGDRFLHRSWHCDVQENAFPFKRWTTVVRVYKDDVNELTDDEDDGFISDVLVGGSELALVAVELPGKASKEKLRESPKEVDEQRNAGDENAGETFATLEQMLKRSTRVTELLPCFGYLATVAINDPVMMYKAMESSDKALYHPGPVKRVKSTEDNGRQTEVSLLSEKFINTTPTIIVDKIGNEVVSVEAGPEDGQMLPYKNVQVTTGNETVTGIIPRKENSKHNTQLGVTEQGGEAGDTCGNNVDNLVTPFGTIDHGSTVRDVRGVKHGIEECRSKSSVFSDSGCTVDNEYRRS